MSRSVPRLLAIRVVAMLLMIAATLGAALFPGAATAQVVNDDSYESEAFPLLVEWGGSWVLDEETITVDTGFERFQLSGDNGILDVVLIEGTEPAESYLDVLVGQVAEEEGFDEIRRNEGDGFVSALVEYTVELSQGPTEVRRYFEVSDISGAPEFSGDEVYFTASVYTLSELFDDAYDEVQADVTRNNGQPIFLGTPSGRSAQPEEEETPEPEEEETPEPEEEETPEPEEEETPEPEEEETPRGSTGEGIDGDTYTSPTYGFTLSWDDTEWAASEESARGVDTLILENGISTIEVIAGPAANSDIGDCVSERAKLVRDEEGVTGFTRLTRRYTLPELPDDAFQRLYGYTQPDEDDEPVDRVAYIECRRVGEDTELATISLFTTDEAYEDELTLFVEVRDTFDVEGGTARPSEEEETPEPEEEETPEPEEEETPEPEEEETPEVPIGQEAEGEPGLDGNTYTAAAFPFAVTFDDDFWSAEVFEPGDAYEGFQLNTDGALGLVEAFAVGTSDAALCVDVRETQLSELDGVSDVSRARNPELPETDADAVAALHTYTFTGENGPVEFAEYVDCRPLVEDESFLRITVLTVAANYDDLIPAIEDLLGGVRVGGASAPAEEEEERPSTRRTPEPEEEEETREPEEESTAEGVRGTVYTSPTWGYSLDFGRGWDVVETDTNTETDADSIQLTNGVSEVLLIGGSTANFGTTPSACQQTAVDFFAGGEGVTNFAAVNGDGDVPIYEETANGTYGIYSFSTEGNPFFVYIQCQVSPDGSHGVIFVQSMPVDDFEAEVPGLNELANAIEFA